MRHSRNPFRLRKAENIDNVSTFLSLFEPGIVEILPPKDDLSSVNIVRSAAGGGKTSLIRLFSPETLRALHTHRSNPRFNELLKKLEELNVIDETGPKVLGATLSCGPGYSMLEDLDIEQSRRDRVFLGLMNARIMLSVLRSALALRDIPYPDGLESLKIIPSEPLHVLGINFPCSGRDLFEWAQKCEAKICDSLDSLGPIKESSLSGEEDLTALSFMQPQYLQIDGNPVADQLLLMMDDVQKLTGHQRSLLIKTVIDSVSPIGIWVAERFEALSTQELLSSGSNQGRDYSHLIEIENYWRNNWQRFEKHAVKLADRRVGAAYDTSYTGLISFSACLEDSLDSSRWDSKFESIVEKVSSRIKRKHSSNPKFRGVQPVERVIRFWAVPVRGVGGRDAVVKPTGRY